MGSRGSGPRCTQAREREGRWRESRLPGLRPGQVDVSASSDPAWGALGIPGTFRTCKTASSFRSATRACRLDGCPDGWSLGAGPGPGTNLETTASTIDTVTSPPQTKSGQGAAPARTSTGGSANPSTVRIPQVRCRLRWNAVSPPVISMKGYLEPCVDVLRGFGEHEHDIQHPVAVIWQATGEMSVDGWNRRE